MNKTLVIVALSCFAALCGCEANLQLDSRPANSVSPATGSVNVPFSLEGDRFFVTSLVGPHGYADGRAFRTLLDTGSAISMVDAAVIDAKPTGTMDITTFNGTVLRAATVTEQLCIADRCDTETVAIVPGLSASINADVVLRGAFLSQFKTVSFNFETLDMMLGPHK
jgi:hypothetical protein